MEDNIHIKIEAVLKHKPKGLSNLDQWLFVAVNTAKSIIDNTSKNNLGDVMKLSECNSTSQIQHEFDIIQGKVANFPDQELSDKDKELIRQYSIIETYLLYEI